MPWNASRFTRKMLRRRTPCRDGGIGKRSGLKIRRWQHLASSSLAPGTRKTGGHDGVATAWPPFFMLDGLRLPPCHAPGRGQPGRVNGCLCAPAGPSTDRAGSASTPPAAYGKHAGSAATTRRTPNEKAAMWCRPRWQRGEPSAAGRRAPTARPPKRFVPS